MTDRYGDRPDTPVSGPAPMITGKARSDAWVVDRRTNSKAAGGGMAPTVPVAMDRPAPTFTAKAGTQWVFTRPATTIVGSFRPDVAHARTLRAPSPSPWRRPPPSRGFRPDYPWRGTRTARFQQIGNSVPPPLAAAVVGALLGLDWRAAVDDRGAT